MSNAACHQFPWGCSDKSSTAALQAAGRGALPRGSTKSFQRGEVEEVETRVSGTRESGCEARRCDHFISIINNQTSRPGRSDPGLITLVTRSVTGAYYQFSQGDMVSKEAQLPGRHQDAERYRVSPPISTNVDMVRSK